MAKLNQVEKLAQAYVANCGDVAAALRQIAGPPKTWTDAKCKKHFVSVYEGDARFWQLVAKYQKAVEQHVAMDAAAIINVWERVAQADISELVKVVTHYKPCKYCAPGDGPDVDCSMCEGKGVPFQDVAITDTDKLSATARMVYDGAEWTKHGIKIKFLSRADALINLAKAKGMFTEKLQLGTIAPELPPLPDDPNEASRIYGNWVKGV